MRPSRRPTLMVAKKVITKLLERFKRWGEVIASRSLRCSLLTPLSSRVLSSVHNSVSLFQSGNNKAEALQTAPPKVSKKLRKKYRKICALLVDNFNDRISFFLRSAARHIAEAIYVALGAGTCALHDAIDNNRHDRYGMLHRCTFFRWPSPPFRHIKVFPRVSRFSGFEVIVSNRFILLPAIFFFFFLSLRWKAIDSRLYQGLAAFTNTWLTTWRHATSCHDTQRENAHLAPMFWQ